MVAGPELPWRAGKDGVVVRVRVTPKSSREAIDGLETTAEGPAFKARVRAVPEDGAANAAVAALLAKWLGVPKRSVELLSGGKSRIKSFAVSGDPAALEAILTAKLPELSKSKD